MKIAFIGAGSVVFTKNLLTDTLSFPELHETTIALHDIDPERLETAGMMARWTPDQLGADAKVEEHLDRRRALEGTDFVVNCSPERTSRWGAASSTARSSSTRSSPARRGPSTATSRTQALLPTSPQVAVSRYRSWLTTPVCVPATWGTFRRSARRPALRTPLSRTSRSGLHWRAGGTTSTMLPCSTAMLRACSHSMR